jgi:hypothetical protein
MSANQETLSDVLGRKTIKLRFGKLGVTVRQFTLKQLDDVKDLIFDVVELSAVTRTYQTPGQEPMTFTDRDLMQGFLKSRNLIPRFLKFCTDVELDPQAQGVGDTTGSLEDLSLTQTMQVFRAAMELNADFFREFLAFVTETAAFIRSAQGAIEGANPPAAEAREADLTQSGTPVGERSPQLFSGQVSGPTS